MPALLALGVVALLLAVVAAAYVSRLRTLSHRVGSFGCQLSPGPRERTWHAGIAHYGADRLSWWRTVSLAPRPARAWSRADLTLLERIRLDELDEAGRSLLLVQCEHRGDRFQLRISEPACAGLVSWLESGPRPVGRVI